MIGEGQYHPLHFLIFLIFQHTVKAFQAVGKKVGSRLQLKVLQHGVVPGDDFLPVIFFQPDLLVNQVFQGIINGLEFKHIAA